MTLFQSILLGIVQGFTEFLPVSSSAHLRLAKWLLGVSDGEHLLYFDLICHSGTLLALIIFLRKEIASTLQSIRSLSLFLIALFPLIPAYFLLKPLRIAASNPAYLGYFLLFTSLLLFLSSARTIAPAQNQETERAIKRKDVLWIGMMQAMALVPGISRSGSTIATARLLGWEWMAAAKFSFLLAIPAILGGQLLETIHWMRSHEPLSSVSTACYTAGFITSFAIGLIGVRFMFWIYETGKVRPFAWYCLAAAIFALWALNG